MSHRVPLTLLLPAALLSMTLASADPAVARDAVPEAKSPAATLPAKAPPSLDELHARLLAAADAAEAKGIAALIERRRNQSGSATIDLLTERARTAMGQGDLPLAVELMDRVTTMEPTWSEGWNRRATLFWRLSDTTSAVADLQRALALEPRHYEAWAALGKLYLAQEDKARALVAFRRAAALHPQWDAPRRAIERLTPDVDGRDL